MIEQQPSLFDQGPLPESVALDPQEIADKIAASARANPYAAQVARGQAIVETRGGEDLAGEQTGVKTEVAVISKDVAPAPVTYAGVRAHLKEISTRRGPDLYDDILQANRDSIIAGRP